MQPTRKIPSKVKRFLKRLGETAPDLLAAAEKAASHGAKLSRDGEVLILRSSGAEIDFRIEGGS